VSPCQEERRDFGVWNISHRSSEPAPILSVAPVQARPFPPPNPQSLVPNPISSRGWPFSIWNPASWFTAGIHPAPEENEMDRTNWIAGVALFAGMLGCADAAADTSDPLAIRVLAIDEVGVAPNTLRQAQQGASRIFAAAGVTLTWTGPEPPGGSLIIKIVSNPVGQTGKKSNVLGVATVSNEPRVRLAWLFYNRIHDLGNVLNLDVSLLLGHVMAHEMGHLLLPAYGSHAAAGLMKGDWDTQQARLASMSSLRFESGQAAMIRRACIARVMSRSPFPDP